MIELISETRTITVPGCIKFSGYHALDGSVGTYLLNEIVRWLLVVSQYTKFATLFSFKSSKNWKRVRSGKQLDKNYQNNNGISLDAVQHPAYSRSAHDRPTENERKLAPLAALILRSRLMLCHCLLSSPLLLPPPPPPSLAPPASLCSPPWSPSNSTTEQKNSARTKAGDWEKKRNGAQRRHHGFIKCVFKRYYLVRNSVIRTKSLGKVSRCVYSIICFFPHLCFVCVRHCWPLCMLLEHCIVRSLCVPAPFNSHWFLSCTVMRLFEFYIKRVHLQVYRWYFFCCRLNRLCNVM